MEPAKMIVDEWIDTEFQGGRHETRANMIIEIEPLSIWLPSITRSNFSLFNK